MATVADAIDYLDKLAALAFLRAEEYHAFGRIGSDDAEALEQPTREHAQHMKALADAVKAYNDGLGTLVAQWRIVGPWAEVKDGRLAVQVKTAHHCADDLAAVIHQGLGITP